MDEREEKEEEEEYHSRKSRFAILIFASLSASCQLLAHNTLTILQPSLANNPGCSNSSSGQNQSTMKCCSDCLGIGDDNYNIMYSIMYIVSIGSTLIAGWSADRFGHKMLIVYSGISIAAHSLIAAAGIVHSSVTMVTLIFTGSFLWGFCLMTVATVRNKIIIVWFRDNELFLAFGIVCSISRFASVPTFLLIELIREQIGLQLTLLLNPFFAICSTVFAVCAVALDSAGLKKRGISQQIQKENQSVKISDFLHLSKLFWPLVISAAMLSSSYYSLMENSVQMVHQKFYFTTQSASMISGVLEYVGIVMFLVSGLAVEYFGRPVLFLLFASSLIIGSSLLLAFTSVHPVIGLMGLGVVNTFYSTAGTGSVALIVPRSSIGIASAVQYSIQCAVITMAHFISAAMLGHNHGLPADQLQLRWTKILLLIASLGLISFVFTSVVTVVSFVQKNSLISNRKRSAEGYENIHNE